MLGGLFVPEKNVPATAQLLGADVRGAHISTLVLQQYLCSVSRIVGNTTRKESTDPAAAGKNTDRVVPVNVSHHPVYAPASAKSPSSGATFSVLA